MEFNASGDYLQIYKNDNCLPEVYDKKFYVEMDGALRAAKVVKVDLPFNPQSGTGGDLVGNPLHWIVTLNVAGVGLHQAMTINYSPGNKTSDKYYASVEDYKKKQTLTILTKSNVVFSDFVSELFSLKRVSFYEGYRPVRYVWTGTEAEEVRIKINGVFWKNRQWDVVVDIPSNSYVSKEDCIKANEIVVVEFD